MDTPRPPSSSAPIAVDMQATTSPQEEEEVYAMAEAFRKAIHEQIKTRGKTPEPDVINAALATTSPKLSFGRSPAASPRISNTTVPSTTTTITTTTTTAPSDNTSEFTSRPPSGSSDPATQLIVDDEDAASGDAASNPAAFMAEHQPASMTSSVRDHMFEGGLRYHAYRAGKYAFPNDETEQNRDDMKHTMTLMLCNWQYFYAPVEEALERGAEVLDLGTGTGIWVIELGDRYPQSTFTGIDLSPIQPTLVPENVHFFVDDFEEEWVDPDNKYDYIHLRYALHSVHDVDALLARVYRHLKPGGYFEIQELCVLPSCDDGSLTPETPYALRDYLDFLCQGLRMRGCDAHAIFSIQERMAAAGFTDIKKVVHKAPLGVWPSEKRLKVCGLFMKTALMDGLRGISRRPLTALGWTPLQIEMFLVEVRRAVADTNKHVWFPLHVVYGRKPPA